MQDFVAFLTTWGFAVLGALFMVVAALVNRFAAHRRRRLRVALALYVLFLGGTAIVFGLRHISAPVFTGWTEHVQLATELLGAFTLVNLLALAVFDVLMPAVGFASTAIAGDVIVGFAYIFAGIGVLKSAGVSASSVVTTSAIVSGVLALSLQTTLGNILGGVALQLDGSVHMGDWLQLPDGTQGRVVAIRWRHTVLETRNWDTLVVPNANLLAQNILILGKRTGQPLQHRMWVYFNVDFRFSPTHVIEVVQDALRAAPIEGVAEDPKPNVICYDFAKDNRDSFAYYAVRYWLTDLPNDDPTNSRIRTRIYAALKRASIPLARPVQTLFLQPEEDEAHYQTRHKTRRMHALESTDLFCHLTAAELSFMADHLRYAPFAQGETCTKQGAVAHWLYILTSGTVEIRRHAEGDTHSTKLATVEAPSFFGEMGLMAGEPRAADVVAVTDVECYRLDKTGLQRILEARPEIAEQFSNTIAKRRSELFAAAGDIDEEAKRLRRESEAGHILDRIQEFFGLARTSRRG
jgi:small-conductance mechanosensitive channel